MKIILISHGDFAKSLLNAAEMIMGAQEDMSAFGIYPGADVEKLEKQLESIIMEYIEQGERVFVLTDVFFGTPFNMTVRMMEKLDFRHFTGVNMPVLLEMISMKDSMAEPAIVDKLMEIGNTSFMDVNRFVNEQEE